MAQFALHLGSALEPVRQVSERLAPLLTKFRRYCLVLAIQTSGRSDTW